MTNLCVSPGVYYYMSRKSKNLQGHLIESLSPLDSLAVLLKRWLTYGSVGGKLV